LKFSSCRQLLHPWTSQSRARKNYFLEAIQPDLGRPVLTQKIFRYARRANHLYKPGPFRASTEGRFAIVTKRWARDAMDASAQKANEVDADGEVVWSWRPLAGVKLATMLCIAPMTVT
jgi:hypothetical protein